MLDRTSAPPFQSSLELSLPLPVNVGSGPLSVFFLPGLRQNVVKIEVIFNAGKAAESKRGVSHFTSTLLEKGTSKKSSVEIAAILDRFGASLEVNAGFDFVSVSLYSLKGKLHAIFPLYLEILTSPVFPEEELQLMKDIFKQNLKVSSEKTSFLASKFIRKNIFGEDHPYGSTVEEYDVDLISRDDLGDFFRNEFKAQSSWVVGDLNDFELRFVKQGLESLAYSGDFNAAVNATEVRPFPWQSRKEGRAQSSIRLGKRSILRTDHNYPDVVLATHVLGGFFGSRLMKNIREEKGLTYGISASLNTFRNDSLFVIGADVNQENVSLAIAEIKKEIDNLMTTPMEPGELSLARNHFIGSLQIDMANIFSVEEKLKNIFLNDLGQNFYQDLLIRIDAITPGEIMETTATLFGVDTLFEVVVG